MQFLFLLFTFVSLSLKCLGVLIPLFIPLMEIKIIAHLPNCFSSWSLILNWYPRQSSIDIKLYIIGIKDILIFIVYFYIFVACNTLIIITCNWLLPIIFYLINFLTYPIFTHLGVVYLLRMLRFVLLLALRGRGWRWFCSSLHVVRGKESFLGWIFNDMTKPPTILKGLLD